MINFNENMILHTVGILLTYLDFIDVNLKYAFYIFQCFPLIFIVIIVIIG